MKTLILVGRIVFGAWLLANGVNHFFVPLFAEPIGHEPLAVQLMAALVHSGLLDVAMGIQLIAGALILAGILVPVALCVVMPITVCALYWSAILEHQPLQALLALAAFALNGFLMLAHLDYYKDMLKRRALTLGEGEEGESYEAFFANPNGRTSRGGFVRALVPLLAVAALYFFFVRNRNGDWVLVTMLFPAMVLQARRLHDMGQTAWLLLVPGVLLLAAIWLHMAGGNPGFQPAINWAALAVSVGFVVWGVAGKGQPQANRFGKPAPA
jgi:uncharacterized membrane protein YhaH (DUF805 family)/uncharacterized membrane protein YphA (DoxX/SURF4 family)